MFWLSIYQSFPIWSLNWFPLSKISFHNPNLNTDLTNTRDVSAWVTITRYKVKRSRFHSNWRTCTRVFEYQSKFSNMELFCFLLLKLSFHTPYLILIWLIHVMSQLESLIKTDRVMRGGFHSNWRTWHKSFLSIYQSFPIWSLNWFPYTNFLFILPI